MEPTSESQAEHDSIQRSRIDRSLRHPVMFFFASGSAWLLVAILLGILRAVKFVWPDHLDHVACLTTGRVAAVHMNVLVYGWACQAAFGVLVWLMARLSRRRCTKAGTILLAGHLWNFSVLIGTLGIFMGKGTGVPWMEFPAFVWPGFLFAYLLIAVWSLIQFHVRERERVFISQWYLLAALFWFPWLWLTAYLFVFVFDGHPLMAAGVASWFRNGLLFLFLAPVAIGSAYYCVPKVAAKAVHHSEFAMFGFWLLAVISPWAGMQALAGAPLPASLPWFGAAAAAMFVAPALVIALNLRKILSGERIRAIRSPSLRFTATGIAGLAAFGISSFILNLPSVLKNTQFSMAGYGYEILGIFGFFSFCMFGAIYFIVPRVTCREWLSRHFISGHYWPAFFALLAVICFGVLGGIIEGLAHGDWKTTSWEPVVATVKASSFGMIIAWLLIFFSTCFFFIHLLLMWIRLGRRSGQPTLLLHRDLRDFPDPHDPPESPSRKTHPANA